VSAPRVAVNGRGETLVAWLSSGQAARVQVAAAGPARAAGTYAGARGTAVTRDIANTATSSIEITLLA
jgi:hypothetical protein